MTVRQSNQEESGEAVVTVPREPTPEMLARGFNCFMAMHDLAFAKSDPVAAIYRVMIAAAPKPATPITTPAIDEEGLAERLADAVAAALAKYSVAYSHSTVGPDLRTVDRMWRVHETGHGNPFERGIWLAEFDNKEEAGKFARDLRRNAAIEAARQALGDTPNE